MGQPVKVTAPACQVCVAKANEVKQCLKKNFPDVNFSMSYRNVDVIRSCKMPMTYQYYEAITCLRGLIGSEVKLSPADKRKEATPLQRIMDHLYALDRISDIIDENLGNKEARKEFSRIYDLIETEMKKIKNPTDISRIQYRLVRAMAKAAYWDGAAATATEIKCADFKAAAKAEVGYYGMKMAQRASRPDLRDRYYPENSMIQLLEGGKCFLK